MMSKKEEEKLTLKSEEELFFSPIVANNSMNRKRGLRGVNSYEKDLNFDLVSYLKKRLKEFPDEQVKWLDLCCGEGKALLDAACIFQKEIEEGRLKIIGLDLVDFFIEGLTETKVILKVYAFNEWQTDEHFDLITCIHGIDYMGNKAKAIERIGSLLTKEGLFFGNFNVNSVLISEENQDFFLRKLIKIGFEYSTKRKILKCSGDKKVDFGLNFKGANDKDYISYTGQPAVLSYYQVNK